MSVEAGSSGAQIAPQFADETDGELLRKLLDAIPAFIFVVDEDLRIVEYNEAAGQLLGVDRSRILRKRGGEALYCLQWVESDQRCGQTPLCRHCVMRNSVEAAFQGETVVRRRARLELVDDGTVQQIYSLISAAALEHGGESLVLLVIEDISQLAELQRIVPICARCRRVRDDDSYWTHVESYFKKAWDVDFSHGYCPECAEAELEKLRTAGDVDQLRA